MTRDEWLALAERAEKAKGPDENLDAEIWALATGLPVKWWQAPMHGEPYWETVEFYYGENDNSWENAAYMAVPEIISSLDGITALIERVLPGWMVRVQWCNVSAEAWVAPDLNSPYCPPDIAADPAHWHDYCERNEVEIRPGSRDAAIRALCAAFCRAMAERDKP